MHKTRNDRSPNRASLVSRFPIIGNFSGYFSNHWKRFRQFFQSLETFPATFPIVGNFFCGFSNRWKTGLAGCCALLSLFATGAIAQDGGLTFTTGLPARTDASFEDALGRVVSVVLKERTGKVAVSALRKPARRSSVQLRTWGDRVVDMPWDGGWVFMVDDAPLANWAHPCRYVFVSSDLSQVAVQKAVTPLAVRSVARQAAASADDAALETVIPFDYKGAPDTKKKRIDARRGAISYAGQVSNCYAVVISGGYNMDNNHIRYWGDVAHIYTTLTKKYGYPKTNVYALVSDGLDPAIDRSDDTNSPWDLDGDGTNDTQASATAGNISNVFVHLQSVLTSNDQLFVFTTDHGGPTDGGGEWDTELNLWNMEVMRDADMKSLTENLPCPVLFVMEQCYSGGFLNDLDQTNRVIATAAQYNESSYAGTTYPWFDQWAYYWAAAMRGFFPQTNAPWEDAEPCDADYNDDGFVSFEEASRFAYDNKYFNDHPMYQAVPGPLGKRSFLSMPPREQFGMGELSLDNISSNQFTGRPVPLRISAQNVFGDVITNYAGTLNIRAEAKPFDPGFYVGSGSIESRFPLNTYYLDSRVQVIYPPETLGAARTIDHFALHVIAPPENPINNLTIRMKHTDLTAYPANPVWETEGWTTVYVSNLLLTATGWVEFACNPAFDYDGTHSLMVDFTLHNGDYDNGGTFLLSEAATNVAIGFVSDNEYGAPLTWSNNVPEPELSLEFPNLRFGPPPVPVFVEVFPTNLAGFSEGVCTGSVTLLNVAGEVRLHLCDATNPAWAVSSSWFSSGDGSCSNFAQATHAPQFSWTSGGNAEWFAQGVVVRDGGPCAAQAGLIADDEQSWLETTVEGEGLASFYWKVSSEEDFDYLRFHVNGARRARISGEVDWHLFQYELSGVSTLRWAYVKDDSASEGDDTGWMTDFNFQLYTGRFVNVSGDLAFGKVALNIASQRVFTVSSLGDEAVTVSGVTVPDGFTADPTNFVLTPQSSTNVTVTFTPVAGMAYTGNVVVLSDAQTGNASLPVSGMGLLVADRFVRADSPSPVAPYTNWATAARTLQDALDFAGEGDTVWVTNGVYDAGGAVAYHSSNRAVVAEGVTLRSVNGAAVTHIVGAADPAATNAYGIGPASVRGVALLGNATLQGFTVRDGSVSEEGYYGGGVCGENQEHSEAPYLSRVSDCVIASNAAPYGGGMAMVNCERVLVEHNRAREWGGGVYLGAAYRSRIANNSADVAGGTYAVAMSNCMIVGNSASYEGGGAVGGWLSLLDSCTIVGNTAPVCGGISRATAHNSVIYHNSAVTYPNYAPAGVYYGSYLYFSCSTPLAEGSHGTNNIADEPRIASLCDPHLLPDSPCINAGTNKPWMAAAADFDGDLRINGDNVDLGADEFWAHSLTDTLQVAIGLPAGNAAALNYPLPLRADITGRCQQTLWELDGIALTNSPLIQHVFTNAGQYEVRLSASNLLGLASTVVTVTVQDVTFYVTTNGSDAADGLSWETAKRTIQAAVDACTIPGGSIWVSNGVYDTGGLAVEGHSNRVAITNTIAVRSVNGPEVTFIHGAVDPASTNQYGCGPAAVRCVLLSGGATLSGFTLAGGRSGLDSADYGGGINCASSAETVSNCVIVGCAAAGSGGGVYRGTLTDCRIEYNACASYGGGAYNTVLSHSMIVGNRASYGGGISSSSARNCLIADNSAILSGGGAGSATLHNCTVIGNDAFEAGGADSGSCVNTILYHNEAVRGPNWMQSGIVGSPSFSYSCTAPMPSEGDGNISADPLLSGMRGGRLLPGSPCVGAGITQSWMSASTDCDGEPRLDGASVDIGWDQLWVAGCTNEMEAAITLPGGDRVAPHAALPVIADDEQGRWLGFAWNFGDGTTADNEAVTSHAWPTEGQKIITLTATNLDFSATATVTVTVENAIQHVALSGSDASDGTSWSTPKQTIQAAVDASIFGGLVLVSNGVYDTGGRVFGGNSNSNRVILTNAVILRSVNGPDVTIIAGRPGNTKNNDPASVRCAMMGAYTRIEGISLTNGHGRQAYQRDFGGGAWCVDETAVISNCVISGCSAWEVGGGVYRGTIYESRLERCTAFYGGGAGEASLYDCVITNNTTYEYDGGGLYGGLAVRCAIVNNSLGGESMGSGTYYTRLSNCVVRGNLTGASGTALESCPAYNTLIAGHEAYGTRNSYLHNCTVTDNGMGVYEGTAYNSIIYGNFTSQWTADDSSNYTFTCTVPLPDGVGCFTNDPLLASDYRLGVASPCINTGSNAAWMAGAADLASNPRIICGTVDMGAYEYDLTPDGLTAAFGGPGAALSWNLSVGVQSVAVYRAEASTPPGSPLAVISATNQWTDASATLGVCYYYWVRAMADGFTSPASAPAQYCTPVQPENAHFVWVGSQNPVAPYTNWATAADNIQDVVDVVTNGALVIVADGVYATGGRSAGGEHALTNRVCLDKPMTLRSLNGPAHTAILGAPSAATPPHGFDAVRGVWLASGAVLSGFTVSNGCTFAKDEEAEQEFNFVGGGVFCSDSSSLITNCIIAGNTASVAGGGVYQGTVLHSTLSGNRTTEDESLGGGAVGATLWHCRIIGNWSANAGGGAARCAMYNSLVTANEADYEGGGVFGGEARNCTVAGNRARFGGGASGVYFGGEYQEPCELYNSIIYGNASTNGPANHRDTLMYRCCTLTWSDGGNNYYGDPLFRGANDYRIASNSPCINRGSSEEWMTNVCDLAGNPRVWGGIVDMGAYEFSADGVLLTALDSLDFGQIEVGTTSSIAWVVGNIGSETLTLANVSIHGAGADAFQLTSLPPSLEGGLAATSAVSFAPAAPGTFTAAVHVVHNASNHPSPFVLSLLGRGGSRGDKYVVKDNPSAAFPFTNWLMAAATIQDAVDAALAGDTIWVMNGSYDRGGSPAGLPHTLTNRVYANKALTIRSLNGPSATFIVGAQDPAGTNGLGQNAVRCAWLGAGVTLSGFTLTNGATADDDHDTINTVAGGVWCDEDNVTITQCVFTANRADYGGAVFGGTLGNCEIRGNWAYVAGGILGAIAYDSVITGNTGVNDGGGAANSKLTRCVVSGNQSHLGGGTFGCHHYDSLIAGNTGDLGGGAYCAEARPFLFVGCVISNNTATRGGGLYDEYDGFSNSGITSNCLIIGNTATMEGGGVYRGRHINPLILGNHAETNAGAAYSSTIHNGTIAGNTAGVTGGGTMYSYLYNGILVDNLLTNGVLENWMPQGAWGSFITYTCTEPIPTNSLGNITNAPLFRAPGDYRLQADSPCINAGTELDWMENASDHVGNRRVIGSAPDMGAYEYLLTPTNLIAATNAAGQCLQLTWTAVNGAGGYAVFRSTNNVMPQEALTTVQVATYCDSTARKGVQYYYWVNAHYLTDASEASVSAIGWLRKNGPLGWLLLLTDESP